MITKTVTISHTTEDYGIIEENESAEQYRLLLNYMFAYLYRAIKDPVEAQTMMYDMLSGGKTLGFDTDHAKSLVTDIINELWECEISAS